MKVIFLDIDGVLNRLGTLEEGRTTAMYEGFIGMEPELLERYKRLVAETGAETVLSSTWRLDKGWLEAMAHYGIEVIDRTPSYTGKPRGAEIYAWLKENRSVKQYAIIDDDSDMLVLQRPNFFQTSYKDGLTEEIAQRIREHFR